jgi:hypothetical protein
MTEIAPIRCGLVCASQTVSRRRPNHKNTGCRGTEPVSQISFDASVTRRDNDSAMRMKKFDCVQMKRLGAANMREQTATLTKEQELAFWRERSSQLRQRQEAFQVHASQTTDYP